MRHPPLAHDPEKWEPDFGKDHALRKNCQVGASRACQRRPEKRLSNEPTGITGCAPASRPLLLAGGAENAVRISRSGARGASSLLACFTRGFGADSEVLFATAFGLAGAASCGLGWCIAGAEAVRNVVARLGFAANSVLLPRKPTGALSVAGAAGRGS